MKKIDLSAGCSIDEAYSEIRKCSEQDNKPCFAVFNGREITSDDTLDEMYVSVTGMTKDEFDRKRNEFRNEYERREYEHKSKIPELTEHYRKEARGVILEEQIGYWDEVVPIRLGDIYHGMELDQVLTISRIMGDTETDFYTRLRKSYKIFNDVGHSGRSANITIAMLRKFCPYGDNIADAIEEFRYDKMK